MISCLKLYAAPLALLLEAGAVKIAGDGSAPATIAARLVVLAAALALSIHELRNGRRRRRR